MIVFFGFLIFFFFFLKILRIQFFPCKIKNNLKCVGLLKNVTSLTGKLKKQERKGRMIEAKLK